MRSLLRWRRSVSLLALLRRWRIPKRSATPGLRRPGRSPPGSPCAPFDLYGAQGGGLDFPAFAPGLGGRATATIPSPPAPRSRSTSAGREVPGRQALSGGGNPAAPAMPSAAVVPRTSGSAASTSSTACSSRAAAERLGAVSGGIWCRAVMAVGRAAMPDPADTGEGCGGSVAGGGGTPTDWGSATSPATEGDFGFGGDGGGSFGGGGGGGWFGGGGGSGAAGGGGGSGFCPAPCTNFETGVRSGDGEVTVTYTVPTPAYDFSGFFSPVDNGRSQSGEGGQLDPGQVQPRRQPGPRRDRGRLPDVRAFRVQPG